MDYQLSTDIITRVKTEFSSTSDQEFILGALTQLGQKWEFSSPRVPRCILFLSKGNLEQFKVNLQSAADDWRDIILWAEYDKQSNRIYNFNDTFAANGV